MQEHKVKFTIGKEGGIRMDVIGGQGTACTTVTRDIELHLARNTAVAEEGKKPEYYEDGPNLTVFNDLN
jgi:hypothetical protein